MKPISSARPSDGEPSAGVPHRVTWSGRLAALHAPVLGTVLALLACAPPEGDPVYDLVILHTNDVHGRHSQIGQRFGTCRPDDAEAGECIGGAARRATKVREIREIEDHVLLVDAGDQFQGTLFYTLFKGDATAATMNALGYDAMVVGNHEFDDGPEVLGRFADNISFPLLATNVDASAEPALRDIVRDSVRIELGDEVVGVVGYVAPETEAISSPGPLLRFLEVVPSVQEVVDALEESGINKIVALSHAGYTADREAARALRGVDVIVGGHTNTLLSNERDDADGPYPTVETSARDEPVLIVTAHAWGHLLGRLDVGFDRSGRAVAWNGEPVALDSAVAEDPDILELLDPFVAEIEEFGGEVIGEAEVTLVGDERNCRFGECNLGNLITTALLEETRAQGVQIALQNGGGIRTSIAQGPITIADVLQVLPFGNTTSTFELRGSDLLEALEHGVSEADDPANTETGRFLQVAGMRYVFDPSRPVGERILEVLVNKGSDESWGPLDPDATYKIACNTYNRLGGDGFEILVERAINAYDGGRVLSDIVIDHILRNGAVAPVLEGRIEARTAGP